MSDPQLDGLLAACAAAPESDDAPWLVLADLLEERGDPRGAAVRLSRRGGVTIPPDAHVLAGMRRDPVWAGCADPVLEVPDAWALERGWLSHDISNDGPLDAAALLAVPVPRWPTRVELTVKSHNDRAIAERALRGWADSPIGRVRVRIPWSAFDGEMLARLRDWPFLEGIDLYEGRNESAAVPLARLAELPNLRHLALYGLGTFRPGEWDAVAGLRQLCGLTLGAIREPRWPGFRPLEGFDRLEELRLVGVCDSDGDPLGTFWDTRSPLRRLTLRWSRPALAAPLLAVGRPAAVTLVGSSTFPDAAWDAVGGLPGLESLEAYEEGARFERGRAERVARAPNLRFIAVSGHRDDLVTNEAIVALSACPRLEGVRLRVARLTRKAADALIDMRTLRLADIRSGEAGDAGLARLRQARPELTPPPEPGE